VHRLLTHRGVSSAPTRRLWVAVTNRPSISEPSFRRDLASPGGLRSVRARAGDQRPKVLLATTSPWVRRVIEPVLLGLSVDYQKASDGPAIAQALLDSHQYRLVVADVSLPKSSGLSVMASARSRGHKVPFVIVQSSHDSLLRVVIGGGPQGVLTTRVVNESRLAELFRSLLEVQMPVAR